jgi:hypothetical protein
MKDAIDSSEMHCCFDEVSTRCGNLLSAKFVSTAGNKNYRNQDARKKEIEIFLYHPSAYTYWDHLTSLLK